MQFQNNFDLEEFLAYLLPGFTLLGLFVIEQAAFLDRVIDNSVRIKSEFFGIFVYAVLFATFSLILGHIFSVIARLVQRSAINALLGDPENCITAERVPAPMGRFFTKELNSAIRDRFTAIFNLDPLAPGIQLAVPRLIRGYVFENSDHTSATRAQLVRHRAICANMVAPLLIVAAWAPFGISALTQSLLVASALILLWKQRDLDLRETKEIYLNFLALTVPGAPAWRKRTGPT